MASVMNRKMYGTLGHSRARAGGRYIDGVGHGNSSGRRAHNALTGQARLHLDALKSRYALCCMPGEFGAGLRLADSNVSASELGRRGACVRR